MNAADTNSSQAKKTDWLIPNFRVHALEAATRYSKIVGSLRLLLPISAACILLVLVIIPNINGSNVEPKKATAMDATMLAPHYTSRDEAGRPFAVDASEAKQHQGAPGVTDLVSPKASIDLNNGSKIDATANGAQYDQNTGKLNVQKGLVLRRSDGTTFTTDEAHVDVNGKNAEGDKPVVLQGDFGKVEAQGFKAIDGGKTVIFTGQSKATLKLGGNKSPATSAPAPQK